MGQTLESTWRFKTNEKGEFAMALSFQSLNWLAIIASVIAAQAISTIWFTALFGNAWAAEYGATDKQQHTKAIPGYVYGVGLVCTTILVLSIAILQRALSVDSVGSAIGLGLFIAIGLCAATGLPGQAFLQRWRVFAIAYGSQTVMILTISIILAIWR